MEVARRAGVFVGNGVSTEYKWFWRSAPKWGYVDMYPRTTGDIVPEIRSWSIARPTYRMRRSALACSVSAVFFR
jgi:hypothetical protein